MLKPYDKCSLHNFPLPFFLSSLAEDKNKQSGRRVNIISTMFMRDITQRYAPTNKIPQTTIPHCSPSSF